MYIDTVPAQNHMPDHYSDYLQGYRAVRLLEEDGTILGELVWRLGKFMVLAGFLRAGHYLISRFCCRRARRMTSIKPSIVPIFKVLDVKQNITVYIDTVFI